MLNYSFDQAFGRIKVVKLFNFQVQVEACATSPPVEK
jgi:hypothetical protein